MKTNKIKHLLMLGMIATFSIGILFGCVFNTSKKLTSITIDTTGVVKQFFMGQEFSSNGLIVTAVYDNGLFTEEVTTQAEVDASQFNNQLANSYSIKVTYGGKLAYYNVTVIATSVSATLNSLELETASAKRFFKVGEQFSADGLNVVAKYTDNTEANINNQAIINSSTFNSNAAGKYSISVSYLTQTKTYDVIVYDPQDSALTALAVEKTIEELQPLVADFTVEEQQQNAAQANKALFGSTDYELTTLTTPELIESFEGTASSLNSFSLNIITILDKLLKHEPINGVSTSSFTMDKLFHYNDFPKSDNENSPTITTYFKVTQNANITELSLFLKTAVSKQEWKIILDFDFYTETANSLALTITDAVDNDDYVQTIFIQTTIDFNQKTLTANRFHIHDHYANFIANKHDNSYLLSKVGLLIVAKGTYGENYVATGINGIGFEITDSHYGFNPDYDATHYFTNNGALASQVDLILLGITEFEILNLHEYDLTNPTIGIFIPNTFEAIMYPPAHP